MTTKMKKKLSIAHKGQKTWNKGTGKKISFICKTCGKNKEVPLWYTSQKMYCSRECWPGNTGRTHFKKGFTPWNKGKKGIYSEETKQKMRKAREGKYYGKDNVSWKGGITSLTHSIRNCFKYRQWRSDIFTRDNFTCILCDKRGGELNVDHYPKMFSIIFQEHKIKSLQEALSCEEFWNLNNGRILCLKCHNKTKLGKQKVWQH